MALTDKVALVTGGARGIGKAICEALLDQTVKVCVTDVLQTEGEETVRTLAEKFGKDNVIYHTLNVVDEIEFENVVEITKQYFGHLDIICNNAGIANESKLKQTAEVNLIGVVNGLEIAHKHLANSKGEKGGTVINTASVLGIQPTYIMPTYSATKHGVVCLTQMWGHEKNVEVTKVKVNAVCPDFTATHMLATPVNGPHSELAKELALGQKDKWLKPSDIADGVIKCLQDDVSGALLVISSSQGTCYHSTKEDDISEKPDL